MNRCNKTLLSCLISGLIYSPAFLMARPTHPTTPIGIVAPQPKSRALLPAQTVKIKGLKAVMLGGEVDGVNGKGTRNYLNYLRQVAKTLRDRGVDVQEFYQPTSFAKIKAAIKDAHFIAYAGHGIGSLKPPKYHTPNPGGMLILKQVWVSSKQIQQEFEVRKGAIVFLLGACFTAGNAGPDIGKIGDAEARQRIVSYSAPFLNGKFGGYYAAWSPGTAQANIAHLFAGKNLGQAYAYYNVDGVKHINHPKSTGNKIWYREGKRNRRPVFDYAFAGKPSDTLQSLFGNGRTDPDIEENPTVDPGDTPDLDPESTVVYSEKQSKLLWQAIRRKQSEAASKAIQLKADPNYNKSGWTVLGMAVYYNLPEVVSELIKARVNVHTKIEGWTPLALADAYKRPAIVKLLMNAGATRDRAIRHRRPRP